MLTSSERQQEASFLFRSLTKGTCRVADFFRGREAHKTQRLFVMSLLSERLNNSTMSLAQGHQPVVSVINVAVCVRDTLHKGVMAGYSSQPVA